MASKGKSPHDEGRHVHQLESQIIRAIIKFLQLLMPESLAKRIMSMALIALGVPNNHITELTGLCDRSVRAVRKEIDLGNIEALFNFGRTSGRKRKLEDVEAAIIEEVNTNNYHTRQQVADMILEKHGISISLPAVGRLLKKTTFAD